MHPPFRFHCARCEQWHTGIPAWGWKYPPEYWLIPKQEREVRGFLTTDLCVVDHKRFFVCGCIESPVVGLEDQLSLRVWLEVAESDFFGFQSLIGVAKRSQHGPFTGRLTIPIPTYQDTDQLLVRLLIRDEGTRPYVEILSDDHALALEQRHGVPVQRVERLYCHFEHGPAEA